MVAGVRSVMRSLGVVYPEFVRWNSVAVAWFWNVWEFLILLLLWFLLLLETCAFFRLAASETGFARDTGEAGEDVAAVFNFGLRVDEGVTNAA